MHTDDVHNLILPELLGRKFREFPHFPSKIETNLYLLTYPLWRGWRSIPPSNSTNHHERRTRCQGREQGLVELKSVDTPQALRQARTRKFSYPMDATQVSILGPSYCTFQYILVSRRTRWTRRLCGILIVMIIHTRMWAKWRRKHTMH